MEAIPEEKEELFSDDLCPKVKLIEEFDIWAKTEPRNDDDALVSKFMEDMMPTKLFCRNPQPLHREELWVFWSKESSDSEHTSINWEIQDRIRIALSKFFSIDVGEIEVLVQFWAAEMIGGRRHLTTTLQPFALRNLRNEKLNEYRKHCVGYKFVVAHVENDDKDLILEDGIVGRVFRNQLPEYCGDLSEYSVSEYPQRDLALSCGINSTFTCPVFEAEPSRGVLGCVGVLELLCTTKFRPVYWYINRVKKALKGVGLRTIDMTEIQSQINSVYEGPIRKEIRAALRQVCKTYKLVNAITWVRYDRSCNDSREGFQGELIVPSHGMSIFRRSLMMEDYLCCASFTLRQGLAGKAFSYLNPYFCRDVSKLSISDCHLARLACSLQLAACFAVCLLNISTGKHEFVIEFFQRRKKTFSADLVTLFSSILATMKQQLKTFEVVTDPENEFFIEVHELGESFVKPTTSEGERTQYSLQSLHSTEFTLNSTCRKPVCPSWNRSNRVNESDQAIPESSFSVNECAQRADLDNGYESEQTSFGNSETASNWANIFGYRFSANQPHVPISNQRRRTEYSHSDGPISEASAVVAHNIAPFTPVSNVEMMTLKVRYGKDIIKFDVSPSSSMADLVENVITRWSFQKDKAFVIKYLDDESPELNLLATDTDLQECMVRTRSRGEKVIRMVIEL